MRNCTQLKFYLGDGKRYIIKFLGECIFYKLDENVKTIFNETINPYLKNIKDKNADCDIVYSIIGYTIGDESIGSVTINGIVFKQEDGYKIYEAVPNDKESFRLNFEEIGFNNTEVKGKFHDDLYFHDDSLLVCMLEDDILGRYYIVEAEDMLRKNAVMACLKARKK